MTVYDLKPAFQNLLRPLVSSLACTGVTPNQITVAALLLSIVEGAAVGWSEGAAWALLAMPVVLFVRMALNAMDGMLAKEHDMQSKTGAMLNEMGDVLSDTALYLPLVLVAGLGGFWVVAFVIGAILTETAGILGAQLGGGRRYDGPMGKSDRAFVVGALCLAAGLGIDPEPWGEWVMIAASALAAWTVLRRIRRGIG